MIWIGAPTANLVPEPGKVMPPYGVYAVGVYLGGRSIDKSASYPDRSSEPTGSVRKYAGVANYGIKPTIGDDNPPILEINIFDFDGDIYTEKIAVDFYDFIRPERRFDTIEELRVQIKRDAEAAASSLEGMNSI